MSLASGTGQPVVLSIGLRTIIRAIYLDCWKSLVRATVTVSLLNTNP